MENTGTIRFEHIGFGKKLKSMLSVDFRRMFTTPLFYIMVGVCLAIPILILVMTTMMDGTVTVDPSTGVETTMEAFDNTWQAILTAYQDQSGKYVTAEAGADGVAVTSIPDNSYDVASKLIPGDIIVGMEGYIISDIGSVREIVSQHKAGDTVQIRFYRNGSELTVSVTLGS